MAGDTVKKILFVVLLAAMGIIWINNAVLFLQSSPDRYVKVAEEKKKESKTSLDLGTSFTHEKNDLSFPDPFQPFFKREIPKKRAKVSPKKEKIIPPEFAFHGLSGSSAKRFAVIGHVSGRTEIIAVGDTCFGVKFTDISPDQLTFIFKGKVFNVARSE